MLSKSARRVVGGSVLALVVGFIPAPECCTWLRQIHAQEAVAPKAQPQPADTRAKDRAAVRAAIDTFVKSFGARDAKALAAQWTAGGEYQNTEGVTVHGREELEKAFSEIFAKTPELEAEVRPESLRFLSNDSAIEEGKVSIRRGSVEPATNANYSLLVVREDGHWRLANLRESPGEDNAIADLGWLIGDWKSVVGEEAEIRTTYAWVHNKKFIRVDFTIKEKDLAFTGTQIIGRDPATGAIRSWTFEADGGIAEADWSRDGDNWELDADGTLADGSTLTETNVLRRLNADTFTWQSTNRQLDDAELPDLPPVKVMRVKSGK